MNILYLPDYIACGDETQADVIPIFLRMQNYEFYFVQKNL